MLRIIKEKQPKFFVAENVKGLLSIENGKVIEMIVKDFENIGYKVDYNVLNSAEYGVPQFRERVIIIGNRLNLTNEFPLKTHEDTNKKQMEIYGNKEPYITVEEVISFLSEVPLVNNKIDASIQIGDKLIYNHIASTTVADKFFGRKHDINLADICDYLKYCRNKSGLSTKRIDEIFGYRHTAGHWFRKDNKSGSIPNVNDWWELKKLLKFESSQIKLH